MDFMQLKYFRTVAKLSHFTKAAQELNITQPSLSKAIARLEESLGVRLFDREGKKIRLNSYGAALLQHVDQMFIEVDEAQKEISDMKDAERGSISVASYQLGRLQEPTLAFLTKHPNVRMYQYQMDTHMMREKLECREIDFAITSTPIETVNIRWVPLMVEEFGALLPANHSLARRSIIELSELRNERFVINNGTREVAASLRLFCERAGFVPDICFEGDQSHLIDALVRRGYGISLIPVDLYQFRDNQTILKGDDPDPVLVPIADRVSSWTIGIAMPQNRYFSAAAQNFINFLVLYFRK